MDENAPPVFLPGVYLRTDRRQNKRDVRRKKMAVFRPFQALRPKRQMAQQTAALPYDVMNEEEAREMTEEAPLSFLHIDRAEVDFPRGVDPYSQDVYQKAAENLNRLEQEGVYVQDPVPCFYLYREKKGNSVQTGIVGCASVEDYENDVIRKHELTRKEKEEDRIRHVAACQAHTGPIFLTCPYPEELKKIVAEWIDSHEPEYDFATKEQVQQTVWVVDDGELCRRIQEILQQVPSLYIADGHHRAASAVRVGQEMRKTRGAAYTGEEEFNYFLSVLFPAEELTILGYHRVVSDLNGMDTRQFLRMLAVDFEILVMSGYRCKPMEKHCFGMYLEGEWYHLRAREGSYSAKDPVEALDVSILQKNVLNRLLGISDPRTDSRLSFVGGSRKLQEIEEMTDASGGVAFTLYPTQIEELMAIADQGEIMPPKSTWFEPKIYSGLFIHKIGE